MIFVTGGTGLVGAHLLYQLTAAGKKVNALKRETSNLQQVLKVFSYYSKEYARLFNQVEWVDGDILDYYSLEEMLVGVTEIYHCAAIVSFDPKERAKMIANNVEGTANLVNAALENGVKKICHVSSVAALGQMSGGQPVTEETNWAPSKKVSGYSESKFFSEAEIWRGMEEGLNAVIVNPSVILGPGNWVAGSSRFFKTIFDGLKFYTKGVTGFVDVNDVARAMVLLMDEAHFETAKNQRYILNSENVSYQELFDRIAESLGKPAPNYFASGFILQVAWRAATVLGWFSRKPSVITRETAAASNSVSCFDGSKITRQIPFTYSPLSQTIRQTAGFLNNDMMEQ